jgi:hypothetical protein
VEQTSEGNAIHSSSHVVFSAVDRTLDGLPVDVILYSSGRSIVHFNSEIEIMICVNHSAYVPLLACNFDPHSPFSFVTPPPCLMLQDVISQLIGGDVRTF